MPTVGIDRRTLLLAALATTALAGCGQAAVASQPPRLKFGSDLCQQCGMILSEPRFACAYLTPDGEARIFDDIGCLVGYRQEKPEPANAVFVHDYDSREWLAAAAATYVHSGQIKTPMNWGLAAFAAAANAAHAAPAGGVLSWQELLTTPLRR